MENWKIRDVDEKTFLRRRDISCTNFVLSGLEVTLMKNNVNETTRFVDTQNAQCWYYIPFVHPSNFILNFLPYE